MGPSRSQDKVKLADRIRAAIRRIPQLGPHFHLTELEIGDDGVVAIAGEVPDVAAKKRALESIAAIPGVLGIADRLHVMPATPMTDKEIRVHLHEAFVAETSFSSLEIYERKGEALVLLRGAPLEPRGAVELEVSDGIVTLNGRVPSLASKRLAGVIAWWVPGVRDVVNGIVVEPPEEDGPDQIAEAVRIVLEKDPFVDASQIKVGVRHRVVRLTGLVPSSLQREAAERDAWLVFGVDDVINRIEVKP